MSPSRHSVLAFSLIAAALSHGAVTSRCYVVPNSFTFTGRMSPASRSAKEGIYRSIITKAHFAGIDLWNDITIGDFVYGVYSNTKTNDWRLFDWTYRRDADDIFYGLSADGSLSYGWLLPWYNDEYGYYGIGDGWGFVCFAADVPKFGASGMKISTTTSPKTACLYEGGDDFPYVTGIDYIVNMLYEWFPGADTDGVVSNSDTNNTLTEVMQTAGLADTRTNGWWLGSVGERRYKGIFDFVTEGMQYAWYAHNWNPEVTITNVTRTWETFASVITLPATNFSANSFEMRLAVANVTNEERIVRSGSSYPTGRIDLLREGIGGRVIPKPVGAELMTSFEPPYASTHTQWEEHYNYPYSLTRWFCGKCFWGYQSRATNVNFVASHVGTWVESVECETRADNLDITIDPRLKQKHCLFAEKTVTEIGEHGEQIADEQYMNVGDSDGDSAGWAYAFSKNLASTYQGDNVFKPFTNSPTMVATLDGKEVLTHTFSNLPVEYVWFYSDLGDDYATTNFFSYAKSNRFDDTQHFPYEEDLTNGFYRHSVSIETHPDFKTLPDGLYTHPVRTVELNPNGITAVQAEELDHEYHH